MSKHEKIAKLKEYIKNFVIKELEKDEELDEASTTASAGAANPMGTGIYYDTPHAFRSKKKKDKEKMKKITRAGGYKPVNEGYGEMMDELEKIYRPSGAPPIAKEALKDLADEYDIGRVLYAARTNRKSFMEVMDMKIDQLQAQHVNKKHINTIKRGKNLKEVVKKEVDAVNKVLQNLKKLRQDYTKIYNMGDKTLKAKHFNKYYEIFLNAEKEINVLYKTLDAHQRGGFDESINEGRYHDWRNDESLTPKQKVGKSVREIRDALNELDKTVKMNLKLKTELNMSSQDYWKNTHKALTKISERLVKMANKIGNLK